MTPTKAPPTSDPYILPSTESYALIVPPKVVGLWDIGDISFAITRRPTDAQIKATEEMFGWVWKEAT